MINFLNQLIVASTLITFCGCSTLKNKTLIYGGLGFLGCSIVGAANAPEDENSSMHGMFYGSACAAGSMAAQQFFEEISGKKDEEQMNKIKSQKIIKERDLKKSVLESESYDSLSKKDRALLEKKWKIYETSNWIFNGEKMIHENYHIEFENNGERK